MGRAGRPEGGKPNEPFGLRATLAANHPGGSHREMASSVTAHGANDQIIPKFEP